MLLLRCSLPADSMSRSTSFCPSTIATRSSSAWVALKSMRFIILSPALAHGRGPTGVPIQWGQDPETGPRIDERLEVGSLQHHGNGEREGDDFCCSSSGPRPGC